jgi:hypothetical protein
MTAILLAIAVIGGAWLHGNRTGKASNEARHVALSLAKAQAAAARQSAILSAETDARQFALAQEDKARAEPVQSPSCLPRSRVLRLNQFAKP